MNGGGTEVEAESGIETEIELGIRKGAGVARLEESPAGIESNSSSAALIGRAQGNGSLRFGPPVSLYLCSESKVVGLALMYSHSSTSVELRKPAKHCA